MKRASIFLFLTYGNYYISKEKHMKRYLKKSMAVIAASVTILSAPAYAAAAESLGWTSTPGLYEIRTVAGKPEWGSANGKTNAATFFHPRSVAVMPDGKVLISDHSNHLIRILDADQVATFSGLVIGEDEAGLPIGAFHDDSRDLAAFELPSGIAVDSRGNIYVADSGNHAVRKITPDGKVTTLAGSGLIGDADGSGSEASFYHPTDVAVDAAGNVYVADTLNHVIRKITPDGKVSTLTARSSRIVEYHPGAVEEAGDFRDGPIASAKFNEPSGLAVDEKGNLYVSDRGNQRIRYIDFASGQVKTVAGGGTYGPQAVYVEGDYADGPAGSARFNAPEGLAVLKDGSVVVADSLNHAIRLIKDGQVTTIAGIGTEYGSADGVPEYAQFHHPTDVAVMADGRLLVADEYGNKIRVLQKYARPDVLPEGGIPVLLNGEWVPSDVPAQIRFNYTYLPVRAVSEALGYEVSSNDAAGEAILKKGDTVITIKNGSKQVTVTSNGVSSTLELNAEAFITQNRMFVPVRFFAEQSDLDIQWDNEERIVVIRSKSFQ
jgi:sugar lactone lactonase YvrE